MPIHRQTDASNTLTTLTATGELTPDDFMDVVEAFKDDPPALNILWDFREAYPSKAFTPDHTADIAALSKYTIGSRSDGKTAYVASSELVYGMCRMFTSQLVMKGALHTTMVFHEIDDAIDWLSGKP